MIRIMLVDDAAKPLGEVQMYHAERSGCYGEWLWVGKRMAEWPMPERGSISQVIFPR